MKQKLTGQLSDQLKMANSRRREKKISKVRLFKTEVSEASPKTKFNTMHFLLPCIQSAKNNIAR